MVTVFKNAGVAWPKVTNTPTTVAGYGITDAIKIGDGGFMGRAPLIAGQIGTLGKTQAASWGTGTTDAPTGIPSGSGNGTAFHMVFADPSYSADIGVSLDGTALVFRGYQTSTPGAWFQAWTQANFDPTLKISGSSCTIAGFQGGNKTSPYMQHSDGTAVPLATSAYVDGKLAQATESVAGINKIATQVQVNNGVDDAAAVTSKKIRLGFFINLSANGYIVLPQWLGSFMIQWGRYSVASNTGANVAVTFPIPFGSTMTPVTWAGVDGSATDQIGTNNATTTGMLVSKGSADTSARVGTWFAFGGAF